MAGSDLVPISRALSAVSDKTGLADLGKFLSSAGVEIISTGGTARCLRDAGLSVKDVS
ncbi:MAG: bifunctional phosphoribosylaminoimidazolecarboxamide formyltransferase/IMP cyclohydrolase, partial [Alphaproteobacteria bacterium]